MALPFLVVIATGILLQLKKEFAWIQPPTMRGKGKAPKVDFAQLLAVATGRSESEAKGWGDVERIDVQPGRGIAKVQTKNRWEYQVDLETGETLHAAYRRSDLIEAMHDGSWFHDKAKVWIFLPSAIVVFALWVTGIYLFVLPFAARRQKRLAREAKAASRA